MFRRLSPCLRRDARREADASPPLNHRISSHMRRRWTQRPMIVVYKLVAQAAHRCHGADSANRAPAGTGARHPRFRRAAPPFLSVNCSARPIRCWRRVSVIRGAFTGANSDRAGLEAADGAPSPGRTGFHQPAFSRLVARAQSAKSGRVGHAIAPFNARTGASNARCAIWWPHLRRPFIA